VNLLLEGGRGENQFITQLPRFGDSVIW
jgi:hypothetical protein